MSASLAVLYNLLVTVAVGPGILAHEYAHYLACRLAGVTVLSAPSLRPFEDDAVLEHAAVSAFWPDFAIAVAPLAVNSLLAVACFAAAGAASGPARWVVLWLGVAFGFTALPSAADTASLFETAGTLSPPLRPVGLMLATPVRAASLSVVVAGPLTAAWTAVLFAVGAGAA